MVILDAELKILIGFSKKQTEYMLDWVFIIPNQSVANKPCRKINRVILVEVKGRISM